VSGEPAHFELGVEDAARARRFYGELLGWELETTRGDDAWARTGGVVGGVHGGDGRALIVLYFAVDDLDAAVRRVRELGGEANEPGPPDPSGRYVECRDDQGVVFGLFQPPG
jgi:predicted enzyme related to lactoylglutathione lyase